MVACSVDFFLPFFLPMNICDRNDRNNDDDYDAAAALRSEI